MAERDAQGPGLRALGAVMQLAHRHAAGPWAEASRGGRARTTRGYEYVEGAAAGVVKAQPQLVGPNPHAGERKGVGRLGRDNRGRHVSIDRLAGRGASALRIGGGRRDNDRDAGAGGGRATAPVVRGHGAGERRADVGGEGDVGGGDGAGDRHAVAQPEEVERVGARPCAGRTRQRLTGRAGAAHRRRRLV